MSSFVVPTDHIDYLVTAVLAYAPDRTGGRTPDALGRLLLMENVAIVTGRELGPDGTWRDVAVDDEWFDEEELAELVELREWYDPLVEAYAFRPVEQIEPAQSAWVAACWQYQRTRQGPDDWPETWLLADAVVEAALADAPPTAFKDPAGPRTIGNLETSALAWGWQR